MKNKITKSNKEDMMKTLDEKYLALRDIRFDVAGSGSKNVKEQKNIKKTIARIKTALKEM